MFEAFNGGIFSLESVWATIVQFGWYIVAVLVALLYSWPYIQERYAKWRARRDEDEYTAKYHKNPDLARQRLLGLEAARQRMQEKYNAEMELARQKEEERKEKKKQEVCKLLDGQGGNILGSGDNVFPSTSSSGSLKPEYNPLMGDSGKRYKPPKRSCCSRGGCG